MSRFSLHKNEILRNRSDIDALFQKGSGFLQYPLKVVFLEKPPEKEPLQVLFMVPKKRFRRAHDRNRLKRLMREAWRPRKQLLSHTLATQQKTLHVALVFVGKEIGNFHTVCTATEKVLHKLSVPPASGGN